MVTNVKWMLRKVTSGKGLESSGGVCAKTKFDACVSGKQALFSAWPLWIAQRGTLTLAAAAILPERIER